MTGSPVAELARSYAVANRAMLSRRTLKAVSFMPSGPQIRSDRAAPKDMSVARAMSTPVTLAAVSYIQRSPGWYTSGSMPSRRIQSPVEGGPSASSASAIGTVPGSAMTTPVPRVQVSRSRSVIARLAGTVFSSGPFGSTSTAISASSGRRSSTGSSRRRVQSSTSVIAHAATIGFVIEPMRQIVSLAIGVPDRAPSNARVPVASM